MTRGSSRGRYPSLIAIVAAVVLGQAGVARSAPAAHLPRLSIPDSQLEMLDWSALDGWIQDDVAAGFAAFQTSCKALVKPKPHNRSSKPHRTRREPKARREVRAMHRALADVCVEALRLASPDSDTAREFFETHFRPVQISPLGEQNGFITGYYEPIVEGSRFPSDQYDVPVYAPPSNLIASGRRTATNGFPNKGRVGRWFGRRKIVPYYDRGEIENGILAGRGLEICWLKDPVDAFFVQIQGSARVKLDTGKTMRINYAAHNGLPYTPVGRILIERGLVPKADMSMDRIRQWMNDNPVEGAALRRANRSFVFMRETTLSDDDEAVGAEGVPLMPRRSIAVDHKLHVYGTPFFISAELPIDSDAPVTPFRQLMIAQDTGGAIVGPARADFYFGAGKVAGEIAGRLKQPGRFVMLVPREIDPMAIAVPAPRPRPPEPEIRVSSVEPLADVEGQSVEKIPTAAAVPAIVAAPTLRLVPLPKPRPPLALNDSQ